jgi:hypothetical protein
MSKKFSWLGSIFVGRRLVDPDGSRKSRRLREPADEAFGVRLEGGG